MGPGMEGVKEKGGGDPSKKAISCILSRSTEAFLKESGGKGGPPDAPSICQLWVGTGGSGTATES